MINSKIINMIKKGRAFEDKDGYLDFINKSPLKNVGTKKVASFYEEEPFPNYDNVFNRSQLEATANKTKFPKAISDLIKPKFKKLVSLSTSLSSL